MKHATWALCSCLLFLLLSPLHASEKLVVHFFGSPTCGECLEIKSRILEPMQKQFPDILDLRIHDIDTPEGIQLVNAMEDQYKVPQSSPQVLFFPDTFLTGFSDITAHGERMIRAYAAAPEKWGSVHDPEASKKDISDLLRGKTGTWAFFLGTLVAGLADGINPCAIATMIFLISFLTTRKKKKSEILTIGLAYTAAVYVTYFSMGMGFRHLFQGVVNNHLLSQIIRWSAFSVAAVVGVFSFRDALRFHKSKDTKSITLQLPTAVKMQIHKIISGNLGGTSLVIGAVVAGVLVTILEAICTGQMYLPYIVAMTQHNELRIFGIAYLAFYNFLFVLPLLIVMVLAYHGLKWNELAKTTQKNMVFIKVLFGLVMFGLAIYLATAGIMR